MSRRHQLRVTVIGFTLAGVIGCGGVVHHDDGNVDAVSTDGERNEDVSANVDGGDATAGDAVKPRDALAESGDASDSEVCSRACTPVSCGLSVPAKCGDCIDNDGDGLVDMRDPQCMSPCDNSEDRLAHSAPAATPDFSSTEKFCTFDCAFDFDFSSGGDKCTWDGRCDPKSPNGSACAMDPSLSGRCSALASGQDPACVAFCGKLTPNGCDAFGCCELPAHSGNFVWLNGDRDYPTACDVSTATNPAICKPCTPVAPTLNSCERCELCVGKRELPVDCSTGPACPVGLQQCGLPCLPECPDGLACITGCCRSA